MSVDGAGMPPLLPSEPGDPGWLRILGFKSDVDSSAYEQPLRAALYLDLDPARMAAIQSVLHAIAERREIRIITQPELVAAVDNLLAQWTSPSVAGQEPISPDVPVVTVGAAADVDLRDVGESGTSRLHGDVPLDPTAGGSR